MGCGASSNGGVANGEVGDGLRPLGGARGGAGLVDDTHHDMDSEHGGPTG